MKLFQTKNRLVEFFLIVFLSAFFVILYFYPLIKNINSSLLNGVKNTEQFIFIWNFWHFDQAVKSGDSIFYTDKIIDLKKHNLYLHTSALWQTITTVFLGNKYIARFNFSFLLSHFLTIIFCFYFFRKLEFNFLFSAFGSLLFNFSSYRLGLYIHLNIANVEFFPLFFLLLFHFLDNPNILNSVWISVVMVIQYFSEYNYFVFMHFSILICFATYWFFDKNKTFVFMKYLCLIYFLCIAAVFPFLKNALIEAFDMKKSIHISFIRTLDYCLDLFAPIIPDCLTGLFSKKIYGHRFNAYLGVPIIFSMLYFLKNLLQKKIRDKNLIIVFILFALFFILSLGGSLHIFGSKAINTKYGILLPYFILNKLPLLNSAQVASRFFIIPQLCAVIIFIYVLKIFYQKKFFYIVYFLVVVCFMEFAFLKKYTLYNPTVPEYYNVIKNDKNNFSILEIPVHRDYLDYQYYQIFHEKKIFGSGHLSRINYEKHTGFLEFIPYNSINLEYYKGIKKLKFKKDFFDFEMIKSIYNTKYVILHKNQSISIEQYNYLKNELYKSGYPVSVYCDDLIMKLGGK